MSDANKPTFSFGVSSSTGTAGNSLFGGTTDKKSEDKTSTPLFGGGAPSGSLFGNTSTSGGFSFKPQPASGTQTPSSSAAPAASTSFLASANTAPSAAPSNVFGGAKQAGSSSGGGGFFGGAQTSSAMGGQDKNSVFSQGPSLPTTSGGGLFQNFPPNAGSNAASGTNTPQPKAPSQLSFTPAGNPSNANGTGGTGLFGSKAGGSGVFNTANVFGEKSEGTKFPSLGGSTAGTKPLFGEVNTNNNKPGDSQAQSSFFRAQPSTSQANTPGTSAPSSLFANPATSAPTSSNPQATPATASSLFANLKKTDEKSLASPAPAAGSLFSPLGQKKDDAAKSSSAQPANTTASAAPAPGLFSASSATQPTAAASQPQINTSSSAPSQGGGLFGGASSMSQSAAPPSSSTPSLGAGLFGSGNSGSQAAANNSTTQPTASGAASTAPSGGLFAASTGNRPSTTAASMQQPSTRLASKSLDEVITMWSTSLATHQKTFASLSERVAKWDRQLVENSSSIGKLYSRVFQAERDCAEVDRQLSNVEVGQQELKSRLDKYEAEVDNMLNAAGLGEEGAAGGVDGERERTYRAAEDCQSRLTDMNHSLSSMIQEINVASNKLSTTVRKSDSTEDPLAQIVRLLNGHLTQLQTIDKGAQALGVKVEQAQRDAGVTASRQGVNGGEWVEGFGRSYLGRR